MSEGLAVVVGRGLNLPEIKPPSIAPAAAATPAQPAAPAPAATAASKEMESSEPEGFAAQVLAPETTPPAASPAAEPAAPAQPHAVESRVANLEQLQANTVALMEQMVKRLETPGEPKAETPDAMAQLIEKLATDSPELKALAEQVVAQGKELAALKSGTAEAAARGAEEAAQGFLFDGLANLKAVYPSLTKDEGRAVAAWFLDPKNHATRQVLTFREVAGRALGNDVLESRRFTAGSPAPPNGAKPAPAVPPANVVTHSVPGGGATVPAGPAPSIRDAVAVILRDHAASLGRYT